MTILILKFDFFSCIYFLLHKTMTTVVKIISFHLLIIIFLLRFEFTTGDYGFLFKHQNKVLICKFCSYRKQYYLNMRFSSILLKRYWPKPLRRRPLVGKSLGKERAEKGLCLWPMTFGELDEEVVEHGRNVPKCDRIPQIMVPSLEKFSLKPYVTYRAENIHEAPMQSKDFFDIFYAPLIEAEATKVPLEDIPSSNQGKSFLSYFSRKTSKH